MSVEEDNTFRALKGDRLLVSSWWCKWGFHKWTKWDNSNRVKTYVDEYIVQKKECAHCGDFKERKKYLIK